MSIKELAEPILDGVAETFSWISEHAQDLMDSQVADEIADNVKLVKASVKIFSAIKGESAYEVQGVAALCEAYFKALSQELSIAHYPPSLKLSDKTIKGKHKESRAYSHFPGYPTCIGR